MIMQVGREYTETTEKVMYPCHKFGYWKTVSGSYYHNILICNLKSSLHKMIPNLRRQFLLHFCNCQVLNERSILYKRGSRVSNIYDETTHSFILIFLLLQLLSHTTKRNTFSVYIAKFDVTKMIFLSILFI